MAQRRGRLPHGCAAIDPAAPFVLAADTTGGPGIVAVNPAASARGVVRGDRLADARAKAGAIQVRACDPQADRRALRRLALWASRYAPAAAPWTGRSGEDGFFLDVTGAAHLLGGEARLALDLQTRLAGFGLPARIAVADTAGAGWALARFGAEKRRILPSGREAEAMTPLPVEALRLDPDTRATLRRLGLKRVGDLVGQPRAPLAKRFGPSLLDSLDRCLGRAPDPLTPLAPPPVYDAFRPVLEPLVSQEAIVTVAQDLMAELAPTLERDGLGARRVRLVLYRVDGHALAIPIGLARPSRDAAHLARLVALRLERLGESLDAGFGFEAVRLDVAEAETMADSQPGLGTAARHTDDSQQAAVIDVLRQRLGPRSLTRLHPLDSHIPERACTRRLLGEDSRPGKPSGWRPSRLRPPLMLPRAEPADVVAMVPEGPPRRFRWRGVTHRVAEAEGPERIAAEWWRRREAQPTRDYYVVEDEAGRRFWLYREGLYGREPGEPRWFMHGLFA